MYENRESPSTTLLLSSQKACSASPKRCINTCSGSCQLSTRRMARRHVLRAVFIPCVRDFLSIAVSSFGSWRVGASHALCLWSQDETAHPKEDAQCDAVP